MFLLKTGESMNSMASSSAKGNYSLSQVVESSWARASCQVVGASKTTRALPTFQPLFSNKRAANWTVSSCSDNI